METELKDGWYFTCSIYDYNCQSSRTVEIINGKVHISGNVFTQDDFFSVNKLKHN